MRVGDPDIQLRIEPTRIIQACRSDRSNVGGSTRIQYDWGATVCAKAPLGHAARLTGGGMKA